MPTDEDGYGRRQIHHQATSPASLQCPAGCNTSTLEHTPRNQQDRFGSERSNSDRLPSGERYQGVSERYPLGERNTMVSVSSDRLQIQSCGTQQQQIFQPERCHYVERFGGRGSYHILDRYSSDVIKTLPPEVYKIKERRYQRFSEYERYPSERFLPIPCPEQRVPYLEPPSPAPASDRFIPPPPLSPANTPSPECYSANAFPSPTATNPTPERFIPPPPLSPSPTENFSPKKLERYEKRYYSSSSSPSYDRIKDTTRYYDNRYHNLQNYNNTSERYVPPHAHIPVERYVPQPQQPESYYGAAYQTFDRYKFTSSSSTPSSNGDPYMRRDLPYHYRLPVPQYQGQFQRVRYVPAPRPKCCQFNEHHFQKSSPGSSSSSSVTSQSNINNATLESGSGSVEIQCQSYFHQQEKAVQCNGGYQTGTTQQSVSGNGHHHHHRKGQQQQQQCRHGICCTNNGVGGIGVGVEYVGQSGGRHVCATPPPRGSVSSGEVTVCSDQCCVKRGQNTSLALTVWRTSPPQQQQLQELQQIQPQTTATTTSSIQTQQLKTPTKNQQNEQPQQQNVAQKQLQRAVSMPAQSVNERYSQQQPQPRVNYSQSERRPRIVRSTSRKEVIRNFIKKETANFFGVDEENENEQQQRWLDRRKRLASRTYGPLKEDYLQNRDTLTENDVQQRSDRPDVLPGPSDVTDLPSEQIREPGKIRRKDSVARMTWDGLAYVVTTLTRHQGRARAQTEQWSRSYPAEIPSDAEAHDERLFFQRSKRSLSPSEQRQPQQELAGGDVIERIDEADHTKPLETSPTTTRTTYIPRSSGWRRSHHSTPEESRQDIGCNRIFTRLLDRVLDNSDRRQYGMGWVGKMFGRSTRRSVIQDETIKEQLDDMEDYRPMFTYWVTTVQILVLFISLFCYGLGPFGLDLHAKSSQVLVTSLSLQQVDYMEPANFWFGPRAADLIHLGAKFAPCMRVDNKILQDIEKRRAKERETACCIRNDDSGCVQSSQADCSLSYSPNQLVRGIRPSKTISTWKKWSAGDSGPGGRISGSVCGLDPKFCDAPASVHPYEWPDDITKWPICRKKTTLMSSTQKNGTSKDKIAEHMVCEVIGHPCCIGIHGQCKITTKEYCDFVQGTFHEEASLCSQVSCLNDVCGMIPFYMPDTPDQFYRLWTSLFLHAGILQLVITVLIQYFLMRDLEKLTGGLRIGIIYIGSGVAGNLASAIFVPYRADVGPAGSQFGLLACLIVEVLNAWPMLKHPNQALCKLLSVTLVLFLIGLLPWVDNYAHLFGFVFGFLLSYALLPFVSFGPYDRQKKIVLIWVCLLSAGFLFICLVLLFYIIPVYDCKACSYFNCLPLTEDFCATQNINFKRQEPIV
ncbi:inactive rhomboid protein 1 isoform X1 [Onthophagus taurus]|uniref:inactive rhomboid protein 1 isoform X1 n=1 Tax=Onthophagus taurus TaxID=166361 RepID=UPI0039BE01C4